MPDPSGLGGALSIDAVQWAPGEGDKLTIRVLGRWRRRRPASGGQPVLVIEAGGIRHRFPAIPEPPSLAGARPGSWEMTFSVPASLAPDLGGRIWLQLGLAVLPLPTPTGPPAPAAPREPEPRRAADPEALVDRRVRTAELAAKRARERQAEAEAVLGDVTIRAQELEEQLEQALREPERLRGLLAERDRQRRAAEQRAHAEQALRQELQEALEEGGPPSVAGPVIEAGELAAAEAHVRELEIELRRLRRRLKEAEGRAAVSPEPGRAPEIRIPEIGGELATVLAELRAEFEQLTAIAEREHLARVAAEERVAELERAVADRAIRSTRVSDAVQELRGLLDQARSEGVVASRAAAEVDPERFDAALSRLRASRPAEPDGPVVSAAAGPLPAKPWLKDAFAGLTARDPDVAGRILVALLPAQGLVHAAAISYDLVLGEQLAVQLTLADPPATAAIARAPRPRDLKEVDFRVTGDHAALARLVNSGRPRRLLRGGRARVAGDRLGLAALVELVRAPLGLDELYDAGVRLEPELALMLAAAMVRPEWTASERFTVAHFDAGPTGPATYLNVRRGELLTVTNTPPLGPVATTIVCQGELLLALLAGELDVDVSIGGDPAPLLGLLGWLERAQRG